MKVYFTNSFLEGCWYVRSLLPLRAGGWDGDRTSLRSGRVSAENASKAISDSDVIVVHRPNDERHYQLATQLKELGKKIVFDNDDTYKGIDAMRLGTKLDYVDKWTDEFIRISDLVTTTTEFLADEYRKINPNVVVLPNMIDPLDWPEPERTEGDKVRIGFVGSVALNDDLNEFLPTLEALCKDPRVQVVLFSLPPKIENAKWMTIYGDDFRFWDQYDVEWQPFVEAAEYADTLNNLKLDIMVIPRKDDYFNRCKSNIKFLESSMLEIPVVAQGFADGKSPYQDPVDSQHMKIVTDNSKWMEALEPLIQDKELRREMGKKAREYVEEKYDINKNISLWENAYESLK